jgi:signal transduction histidine kinase
MYKVFWRGHRKQGGDMAEAHDHYELLSEHSESLGLATDSQGFASDPLGLATGTQVDPTNIPHQDGLSADELAQFAHDLRTPIATIALETLLLTERAKELARVDAALVRIRHNTEFIDRMINDLLDTCVLETGGFLLVRQRTELTTLLENAIERCVATRDRGRVFFEAPRSVLLDIDDLRVERVFANLLSNALKFSPSYGAVVVRLECDHEWARVSVADTGPGMTQAECEYIFERYRRAPGAHATRGHGLGLFISRAIVEAHGGEIGVESIRGAGTRFFFTLPLPRHLSSINAP